MITRYWRAYRPPATDVVVAAAFVVLGQVVTWGRLESATTWSGSRPTNALLNLLLMAALAWRRRAPLAAVSWAVAVYFLPQAVVPHDMTLVAGGVPLIVLAASAAYYCDRRRAVLAAALALVGLGVASIGTPELSSVDSLAWNTMLVLLPWLGARSLREREDRAAALATALAVERTLKDAAWREAAAQERAHIARELHDIVAHSVSMMVIQVGAARMQLQRGAAGVEAPLLDAEDAGRQTLEDLRRLLGVLRADGSADIGAHTEPERPQPGLSELDALLAPIRDAGLDIEVEVRGDVIALPAALNLTAYRIVQEALTNTLKHSGATRGTVRLTYTPSVLLIDVVDDGTAAPAGDGRGHGLVGLSERVSLFGGTVSAGRVEHRGWRVQAELPVPVPARREPHTPATSAP
jgi:signal transduction histidine kinase